MQFVAVAKTGVHIYDATKFMGPEDDPRGSPDWSRNVKLARDWEFDPQFSLPPSSGPAGFDYSKDGRHLATVDMGDKSNGAAVVWDATADYAMAARVDPVGNSGGVRAVKFSPCAKFLVTHEKYEKEKCPTNVHVWDLRLAPHVECAVKNQLRGYASGKVPFHIYQWTSDDKLCLELAPGTGVKILDADMQFTDTVIPETACGQISVSDLPSHQAHVGVYVPESIGKAGYVAVYSLTDPSQAVVKQMLPNKLNGVTMSWNKDGSSLLVLAGSDVDPTGESYFGTSWLFLLPVDGKAKPVQISGPEDGLVQDVAWSPNGVEILVILGMMPAKVGLYDGKTGKLLKALGTTRRNTIRWSPFGRFFVVGGFGALPGDMDFFDNVGKETLCSFRGHIPVDSSWSPDGRHFLTCTICPRMNEDNQVYIYGYTGNEVVHLPFSPKKDPAMAGKLQADAGAMLYAAAWRPDHAKLYQDRPASPRRGPQRIKGVLPSEGDAKSGAPAPKTFAAAKFGAGGAGGVAAMMRGEAPVVSDRGGAAGWGERGAPPGGKGGGKEETVPEMTWEEVEAAKKQRQKDRKDVIKAKSAAQDDALDEAKKRDKKALAAERKVAKLKEQLDGLDALKEKEWDELTSEDEKELETELELKEQIKDLEEKIRTGNLD